MMNTEPNSPEAAEADDGSEGGSSGLIDIVADCVSEQAELRRSPKRHSQDAGSAAAIPPAAQMVLGAVFGFMPCLIGWLSFTEKMSSGNFGNPQLAVGLLSSGLLTVTVVLAVQAALSIFLIYRKLRFAAIGVWLVYLPFCLLVLM